MTYSLNSERRGLLESNVAMYSISKARVRSIYPLIGLFSFRYRSQNLAASIIAFLLSLPLPSIRFGFYKWSYEIVLWRLLLLPLQRGLRQKEHSSYDPKNTVLVGLKPKTAQAPHILTVAMNYTTGRR